MQRWGSTSRSGLTLPQRRTRARVTIKISHLPRLLTKQLVQMGAGLQIKHKGDEISLLEGAIRFKAIVLRMLLEAQVDILALEQQRSSLEEVYLHSIKDPCADNETER